MSETEKAIEYLEQQTKQYMKLKKMLEEPIESGGDICWMQLNIRGNGFPCDMTIAQATVITGTLLTICRDRLIATCRVIVVERMEPESPDVEPLKGECRKMDDVGMLSPSFVHWNCGYSTQDTLTKSRMLYENVALAPCPTSQAFCELIVCTDRTTHGRKGVCLVRDNKFLGHTLEWGTDDNERIACVAKGGDAEESDRIEVVELREVA